MDLFHFVPTSCSWLNAIEGFFAKPTRRRLKHSVFHSVVDLQAAINRLVTEHNREPKPFIWKAGPDEIIAAVKRGTQRWNQSTRAFFQEKSVAVFRSEMRKKEIKHFNDSV